MRTLDPTLATKFIEKFSHVFENNINIMDSKGIIIGSKDHSRIGTFHEIAYELLSDNNLSGDVVDNSQYIGTKKGVNFCIKYQNKPVGVVGVSGSVDKVRPIGLIIKTAIEAMLDYEFQMENERIQHTKVEQFLYSIIYDENFNKESVVAIASTLNYKNNCVRIPIIINCHNQLESKKIIQIISTMEEHSKQDIVTVLKNNHVIIFKFLKNELENAITHYKEEIDFFITSFTNLVKNKIDTNLISFYVGTLQNKFKYYKESYAHSAWLSTYIPSVKGVFYFYDYVSDYLKSLNTIMVYDQIFNTFTTLLNEEKQAMFVELFESLIKNNYNVVNSAKDLYIHRNTLLFRINKINLLFNIDPVSVYADREFVSQLVYYYKNKV